MNICSINTHVIVKIYFLSNKGFINVCTIKLNKHKNDRPHGIVKKSGGIIMSIIFSFRVQLFFFDKLLL